jgi:hypothetical protein
MEQRPKKLLDHGREAIRLKHYSRQTEQAYITWIKRYIFFRGKICETAVGEMYDMVKYPP